ncbi:hypothetical protein Tco_0380756, partial [Tanacetum coccineum]
MSTSSNGSTPTIKRKIIQDHLSKLKSNQVDPHILPTRSLRIKTSSFSPHDMSMLYSSSVSAGYIIEFMLEDLEAVPADYVPFLLIMFLLVMFSFLLTDIESADLIYR